jgi:hypothetical protein
MENERQRLASEWQMIGHETKVGTHNLFLTFVVVTIGFGASVVWMCDCKFSILYTCIGTPIYFLSLILLFITLFILFEQSKALRKIAFNYSEVLGNNIQDAKDMWPKNDLMHKRYYWNFNLAFYLYVSALLLLITSILLTVYNS